MEHIDDCFGEFGEFGDPFRQCEHAYLALLRGYLERPGLLRDLLEVVVWEDYDRVLKRIALAGRSRADRMFTL